MSRIAPQDSALHIASAHSGIVWPLLLGALSSDDVVLFSGAARPDVRLCCWDATTGEHLWATWDGELCHGCFGLTLVRAPGGRDILAAATEAGVQRWEARSGAPLTDVDLPRPSTIWGVDSCALGDGRSLLAGAGNDHLVHRWDAVTGAALGAPLAGHHSSVKCVAARTIPGRGALIASGSDDGTVRRWDALTGECVGVGDPVDAEILDVGLTVSRAGMCLLTAADGEGAVHRWDAVTGERLGPALQSGERVGSLATADVAGEPRIFASSESGLVRQWHAITGRLLDVAPAGMSVAAVPVSDGRTLLATGTRHGDISVRAV